MRKPTPTPSSLPRLWRRSGVVLACMALSCTSREEKAVELVEAIADVFEKHGEGDCDKLADKLDALVRERSEDLAALAESDKTADSRARSAKFKKRIGNAVDRIVQNAAKCGAQPRVQETLGKIL
jgi:demethoxyubiquinone hydroxylase (CLK1/Coq7/Cat5 family)